MYNPYEYSGLSTLKCEDIPDEIDMIMREDYTKRDQINFFIFNVMELDKRLTLGLEVFDGKKKIFTKFF
jgi:hypothetical protein